jgi:DNA-binding response OmpR family regulator
MDKRKILVIDDAPEVRKLLRFHLENKGYTVFDASDGAEGLALIHERQPDLIILDINMPKVSGLEVYYKLIAGTGRSVFPVLILTTRTELGQLFKDLDVDGFITKPFDVEKALMEIDTIMVKKYRPEEAKAVKIKKHLKKVLVVENNADDFEKIVLTQDTM